MYGKKRYYNSRNTRCNGCPEYPVPFIFFEFEISTHTYHKATSDSDIIVHKYILQIKITSRSGRYCLFCIAIMDKISNIRAQKTIVHIAIKACVV